MSDISRRPLLIALGSALGMGVVGGGIYEATLLWRGSNSPAGYEDLLAGLGDHDQVNRIGAAYLDDADTFETRRVAHELRRHIAHRPLATVLQEDAAQDRVVEAQGWVLPETLALLCGLSAKLG